MMPVIRITQHKNGIIEYLEFGKKRGCDTHRDQRDIRVPLLGNLNNLQRAIALTDRKKNWKANYWHFTISLPWQYNGLNIQIQQEMVTKVLGNYFHLYDLKRIAFYAEEHKPILQTAVNQRSGLVTQRLSHIHLIICKMDLWTGNQHRILPYKKEAEQAFQVILDDWLDFQWPFAQDLMVYHQLPYFQQNTMSCAEANSILTDFKTWHKKHNAPTLALNSDNKDQQPLFDAALHLDITAFDTLLNTVLLKSQKMSLAQAATIQKGHKTPFDYWQESDQQDERYSCIDDDFEFPDEDSDTAEENEKISYFNLEIPMSYVISWAAKHYALPIEAYRIDSGVDERTHLARNSATDIRTGKRYTPARLLGEILNFPVSAIIKNLGDMEENLDPSFHDPQPQIDSIEATPFMA